MKVRCIDNSHGPELELGREYEVAHTNWVGHFVLREIPGGGWRPDRFEPVTDEAEAHAGEGVMLQLEAWADPYEEHRVKRADGSLMMSMLLRDKDSGATARLHAGLESEKVRGRVKPFPHPARNPR